MSSVLFGTLGHPAARGAAVRIQGVVMYMLGVFLQLWSSHFLHQLFR